MKKLYDVEIVVCPDLLIKQRNAVFELMDSNSFDWTPEMWDAINGLVNMLDAIDDQINNIAN